MGPEKTDMTLFSLTNIKQITFHYCIDFKNIYLQTSLFYRKLIINIGFYLYIYVKNFSVRSRNVLRVKLSFPCRITRGSLFIEGICFNLTKQYNTKSRKEIQEHAFVV